jgi:hypothetical protein
MDRTSLLTRLWEAEPDSITRVRFIQAAREHECELDEAAFDEALRKVFPPKGSSQ